MSSIVNKIANSVTSGTSSLIGRDKVTRLTNTLNKGLTKSKYRDLMKRGNTVQIISRSSHMSLHICVSQNDASRLILLGNGQIGPEALNSHFIIEKDKDTNHFKFKNGNNYIAFDNEIPCILSEPVNPRTRQEQMRARNEFRIVEILGSDEYFCLESVYFPGRFLSVLPDGSITSTRDRTEDKAQFCINIIHVMPVPGKATTPVVSPPVVVPIVSVSQPYVPAPGPGVGVSGRPISYSTSSQSIDSNQPYSFNNPDNNNNNRSSKAGEAAAALAQNHPGEAHSSDTADAPPPNYSNIFPTLPKLDQ
jgi:hypothetical protein